MYGGAVNREGGDGGKNPYIYKTIPQKTIIITIKIFEKQLMLQTKGSQTLLC